jgi:hypothetical protein
MDDPYPASWQIRRAERAAAGRARRPRRDTEANRERVLAAAASALVRGPPVAPATIAAGTTLASAASNANTAAAT